MRSKDLEVQELEEELDALFDTLWPLPRSITGEGTLRTLEFMREAMGLEIESVASGTQVFDWEVPPVWRIRDARLTGPGGDVVADFRSSNLSVINYACPVDAHLSLEELQPYLHSLPALPAATPYVTSYYHRRWGFCLPHSRRERLQPGTYHAWIDSDFEGGDGVPFGQVVLPGETRHEVLLTSYVCHPSLANNELSGPLTLLGVFRLLQRQPRRRFTYRFVLHPETIGSLCYLWRYGDLLRERMVAGLVLTCTGGPNQRLSYKETRLGDTLLDEVVRAQGDRIARRPFTPTSGSDERQYGSPGFKLPVGQLARTVYGQYEGYHNSLDDKAFMDISQVVRSAYETVDLLRELELAAYYRNHHPFGEPQLSRRDLYPSMNAASTRSQSSDVVEDGRTRLRRILWVLNGCDGSTSMMEIARRAECSLLELESVIEELEGKEMLSLCDEAQGPAPWRKS